MKYYFFLPLLLILLTTDLLIAQYYEDNTALVDVGKPYRVIDAAHKHYFHKDGQILTVKIDGKTIFLQKIDAGTLSFIQVKEYEDMPKDFQIEAIEEFNDRFFLFYSLWDNSKELEQLFYREIDFVQGTFIGQGTKIVEVEGKLAGLLAPKNRINFFWTVGVVDKFDFQFSHGEDNMLVQYRMKPAKRRDAINHDIIGMSVFDKDLNLLWKKEVEMPYTEKKMNNLDYSIDSEGNTYILASVFDDNSTDIKKSKDGEANYHIELLRIKANSSEIKTTPITLADKFISEIALFESPANYMVCAGFYNKGKELDDASGIVIFKVGAEGEIYDLASYEIPLDVLNQYARNKDQRKNARKEAKDKAEFEDLDLRELRIDKEGNIILIGEQAYTVTHTYYSSNGRSTTTTSYHYDDLLLTKINADGTFGWMKKLPKKQKGFAGRGGMSYKYIPGENSHYLLFLDNFKNLELALDKVPEEHLDGRGGFLTAYKVDDTDGETSKISLLDTRDVKGMEVYQFMTSRIVQLNLKNEFVVEVYKKKKEDVLLKVAIYD